VPPEFNSLNHSVLLFGKGKLVPEIYVPYGTIDDYCQAEGWNGAVGYYREYPALPSPVSADFAHYITKRTNLDQFGFMEIH
jgi:hypothetical protein